MLQNLRTKEELIAQLIEINLRGWIRSGRQGNDGAPGNTLEDLLGIEENNLPIPNAAEWELKTQRITTTSLTTLFHMEPSPRGAKLVPRLLLPYYGWPHQEAGKKYPANEMSFRQTIAGANRSDRGFKVVVDDSEQKVKISFDQTAVGLHNADWKSGVRNKIGLAELNPQPYWGFNDLLHKAGTKLLNCFFVQAENKIEDGIEYFHYTKIMMLKTISIEKFTRALINNYIYVDFDARTGHNHGTKFRLRRDKLPELYEEVTVILNG